MLKTLLSTKYRKRYLKKTTNLFQPMQKCCTDFCLTECICPSKNGWIDNQGRVYQYFTIKSAQEKLHFGHEKICKLFSELETSDLILRKKQGQGKPSIIYLKQF